MMHTINSKLSVLALLLFGLITNSFANDSVVEVSSSGLVFSEEKNISMLKEKLDISANKISVQYEFFNDSKNDIDVTVGFPIPPFGIDSPGNTQKYPPAFNDFKVFVNDVPVSYSTEVKAVTENGVDVTDFLKAKKINYANFGGFDIFPLSDGEIDSPTKLPHYDINKLSTEDKKFLILKGAIDKDTIPLWMNKTTYYWKQRFPAGQITRVTHTYSPYSGASFTYDASDHEFEPAGSACLDSKLREKFVKYLSSNRPSSLDHRVDVEWVRYILITANSWKMPIKDFELTLKKPNSGSKSFISLCWDGTINKISETEFKSSISNFKPEKDLLVYWYRLD